LRDELQTFDLDFQHRRWLGPRNAFTWGIGLRNTRDVVDNAPALAFLPRHLDQQLYSAFAQDEIRLTQALALTVGTKVEHNDYTGFEWEPSLRLQWQAAAAQTVWGAASRAVRAPSRIDRDLRQGQDPWPVILKGSDDFKSEHVIAYELGYRAQAGTRFTTSLAMFYNVYGDVRSPTITADTVIPFYFENGVAGQTWGAEWTGTVQVTANWTLRAGYVLLKEDLHVKSGHVDITNGRNEVADPQQQAALHSSLDLPRRVTLDMNLRWVDTLQNSNGPAVGHVSSYMDLDARVGWHASDSLELALSGSNLLHQRHPEYGFPSPTRAEAQRSFQGQLVWRH
jgi:iron complex outermembrane receptor protein